MSNDANGTNGDDNLSGQDSLKNEFIGITKHLATDLHGTSQLTVDAITGIADIAESLHSSISHVGGLLGQPKTPHRTSGLTGFVYQNVRNITKLIGKGIAVPLKELEATPGGNPSSTQREAVLAALNGVIGDHLYAQENPLAIPMQIRRHGLPVDDESLRKTIRQSSGRLVVLIHGLCMNDLQWTRQGHNHGDALAKDLGISPLYIHYNTGLHISENGRKLADLLEKTLELLAAASADVQELHIIAHSMGGLVSRSACHYGMLANYNWLKTLKKIVFLGTPHHGAPLERGGNLLDAILGFNPYTAPFARLGKIRSSGVTDLRHGYVLDDHWQYHERFDFTTDQRSPVSLPNDVECYSIATTSAKDAGTVSDHLVGDGLVTLNSALGVHKNADLNLDFPEENQWIGRGIHHIDLLSHPRVYEVIKCWLG